MEEKEAVELLEKCDADYVYAKAIKTILNLLDKKDKIIDLMAEWLYSDDTSFGYGNLKEVNTANKIKQYFEKKVDNT